MKKEDLMEFLPLQGYSYEKDSEYNRDVYINSNVVVDGARSKMEILADYYSIKVIWWYTPNNKVSTSIPTQKADEGLLQLVIKGLIDNNKPKQQTYTAYTDGSADNKNPQRPGGAAYIILDNNGNVYKKNSKGFMGTSNNRMELIAIISVVNAIPYNSSVTIYTDSQYCIKAVNIPHPIKNADQLTTYHRIVNNKHLKVEFKWIKGHNGNKYNEECDKMARGEYSKMASANKPKAKQSAKGLPKAVLEERFYSCVTTKNRRKPVRHSKK